jgi:crotonobetainyl-CoA:carnitine CoA-transferase CaiB-like acyl-CoA transferase
VGPIEDKFYLELLRLLDVDPKTLGEQLNESNWPAARALFALKFKRRTREQWTTLLERTDACFAPVLSWVEAPEHAHLKARGTFIEVDGIVQPAPAPRFSATVPAKPTAPEAPDAATVDAALAAWLEPERIDELKQAGTLA